VPGAVLHPRRAFVSCGQIAEVIEHRWNKGKVHIRNVGHVHGHVLDHRGPGVDDRRSRRVAQHRRQLGLIQGRRRHVKDHPVIPVGQAGERVVAVRIGDRKTDQYVGGPVRIQVDVHPFEFPLVVRSPVPVDAVVEEIVHVIADAGRPRIVHADGAGQTVVPGDQFQAEVHSQRPESVRDGAVEDIDHGRVGRLDPVRIERRRLAQQRRSGNRHGPGAVGQVGETITAVKVGGRDVGVDAVGHRDRHPRDRHLAWILYAISVQVQPHVVADHPRRQIPEIGPGVRRTGQENERVAVVAGRQSRIQRRSARLAIPVRIRSLRNRRSSNDRKRAGIDLDHVILPRSQIDKLVKTSRIGPAAVSGERRRQQHAVGRIAVPVGVAVQPDPDIGNPDFPEVLRAVPVGIEEHVIADPG